MTDDGHNDFRVESAVGMGFELIDESAGLYNCTREQLIKFALVHEYIGRQNMMAVVAKGLETIADGFEVSLAWRDYLEESAS